MNPPHLPFAALFALSLALALPALSQDSRTVRVQFEPGADNAVLSGRITGDESIAYRINAREGQHLQVSLRPDNQSANYNVYLPGRGPGEEALHTSADSGHEYTGQLYASGDHTIVVFLMRNAARRGETAHFDLVVRITNEPPGPLPAEVPQRMAQPPAPGTPGAGPVAWERIPHREADHGVLLQRMAAIPPELARTPVAVALLALEPSLSGHVTDVAADYDTMESPTEAKVTVVEGGILDDDLHGVRHLVDLARNSNGEWRIVGYQLGERRREHMRY